jgi:adhesin transport system outer membrane protein
MEIKSIICHMILCLGVAAAPGLHAETLVDAVRDTIESNPEVQIARDQRNAVKQEMEQARAGFFPSADVTVGNGWESSNNPTTRASGEGRITKNRSEAEVLVRQLLFDGFGTESEFDRQKARVNASAYATFGTAEIMALRAAEAYLDVLNTKMLVSLAEENLRTHEKNYSQIRKRGERGVGRKSDTQQALGRLALARTNLITEQNNLEDAISAYENIVGHTPDTLEEPPSFEHLLPESLDGAITQALDNQPTLKSAEADVEAARKQHDAAKSTFFPRVHLEISGTRNDDIDGIPGSNRDAQLMLRGRYSFTGGRDMARRQETAYLLSESKQVRNRTRRQVIESMQLSWNAYERAKTSLESLKIHVEASRKARNAYRKQFNIGQRTLLDLLDSDNELFTASIDYANGKRDYMLSIYRILAGSGRLLWAMQIPVPEEATTIQ